MVLIKYLLPLAEPVLMKYLPYIPELNQLKNTGLIKYLLPLAEPLV